MEVRPDIALPEDVDMAPPPPPEEAPPPPPPEEPDGLETMLAALEVDSKGLSEALTPNVPLYIQRASELLFAKDDPEVFALELAGVDGTLEQRCVLAKCALKCALKSCESRCRHLPATIDAAAARGLVMFTERLRSALEELEESSQYQATPMCLSPRAGRRESDGTASTDCTAETAPEAVDLVVGGREGGLDDDVVWSSAFGDFVLFCGGMSCLGGGVGRRRRREPADAAVRGSESSASTMDLEHAEDERGKLDRYILPRGAAAASAAANAEDSLPLGARGLLESTSRALLAAAEEAASDRNRGAAARCFQRAALHLEILRLLGGRPLTAPLETSRRYARWRARHLSHLLENCVLEHGPEDPRLFEDVYEATDEVLGKGGYGVVFKVTRRVDGEVFACKQLELGRLSSTGMAQLHEEVNAMRALDHPHICRLREVFYSERRRCYLVLELCKGGELFDVLDRRAEPGKPAGAISERRVAQLVTMMVGCIRYMHDRGVCHRDIKLENWLFDTEDVDGGAHLKLVDFGLAKVFGAAAPARAPPAASASSLRFLTKEKVLNGKRNEFHDRVGSAYYCAPEILGGDYDRRCDLWSLGVIAYMLLCGAPPFWAGQQKGDSTFWGSTDREILKRVKSLPLSFPEELFGGVSETAVDFVAKLLERDVDKRLTPAQALAHPFLAEANSIESIALETLSGLSDSSAVDVDSSNTVGFHEFVAAAVLRRVDIDDRALHAAFDAIDSEGLGYITPESVRATVGIDANKYGDDGDIDRFLEMADSDGDGKVDYAGSSTTSSARLDGPRGAKKLDAVGPLSFASWPELGFASWPETAARYPRRSARCRCRPAREHMISIMSGAGAGSAGRRGLARDARYVD
ncbi:serine/threonine kinase [Aureococcus anophagefferens]|nr:serine/threonine kinase [Aureococcus anophagefferens]